MSNIEIMQHIAELDQVQQVAERKIEEVKKLQNEIDQNQKEIENILKQLGGTKTC